MPDSPLTINYPASLDTVVSLGEVANRAATTLSASIVTGDLSLPLTDSTGFPATGVVTLVDSLTAPTKIEDIIYTANAANALTVPAGGRGAFGTTAQNWSGTVYVRQRYLAEHHEALRDAIIQLETIVGADATALSSRYQPLDADLTAIAGLSPSNDDIIQRKAGAWTNRTIAQLKTDLNYATVATSGSASDLGSGTLAADRGGAGSINGILKANGSGVVSQAVAGTDYLSTTAPGSSGDLLHNNANAYAAASLLNYAASGSPSLTVASNADGALFVKEAASGSPTLIQGFPALFTLQVVDDSTFWQLAYTSDASPYAWANFLRDDGHLTFSAINVSTDASIGDTHVLSFGGIAINNGSLSNTSFGMVYQSDADVYALGRDGGFDLAATPANVDLTWGGRGITLRAPASAIADGSVPANHVHFYLDEAANELKAKWKESGGTVLTATLNSSGGTPGGSDTQLQYNNAGAFDGISGATSDGTNVTFGSGNLRATSPAFTTNQTTTNDAIGTTSTDGIVLQNTTAAAAGAQQYSPRIRLTGQGWKTNATAASQTVDWILEARPVQGAANPTVNLAILAQVNAGGYTAAVAPGQILAPGGGSSSQSAPQYSAVNNTGYGLRIGGGNVGNAVGVIAGSVYLVVDANVNAITIPANSSLRWGAANFGSRQVALYSPANDVLQIRDRNASTVGGNLILGGSGSSLPTSATATLVLQNGTAPGSSPADQTSFYSADWNGAGTAAAHFRNEEGHIIKLARVATYTPSNVSTDRSFDADATTLDEIADVLGTVIADLQTLGIFG